MALQILMSPSYRHDLFNLPSSRSENGTDPIEWVLQPGSKQVAAGYVVYGSSTVMVYSAGNGVHGFTLDPSIGSYILTHENIRMPRAGFVLLD